MFGTSGIRGLYGKEITEELALRIGNIFSGIDEKDVVIGRDIRNTGESLENAVISGVLSSGKNAISIGIVPTPTLALVTKKLQCNGIQLTASHNPPEYNGLKLFSNGLEINREKEKEISGKYKKNELNYMEWNKLGKLEKYSDAIKEHKQLIISLIDSELIKNKKPKIVVDSNGPGTVITPSLLKELGCEVISINDSLEGFSRASEPNKENLRGLAEKVKKEKADLGIGHDGDADRTVVVDETGDVLALDVQLGMMIEYELEKNILERSRKIVTTVEASLCVREAIEKNGAVGIITPVGSLYVSEELKKENAVFGGEPCGEYVFQKGVHVPDGILSAAKFVELFCKKGKLSELKKKYKTYEMLREKFECENGKKYKLVEKIEEKIEKLKIKGKIRDDDHLTGVKSSSEFGELHDGIRVDEEDGWFLVRASGTEPYIRLTMEYKNKEKLGERAKILRKLIKSYI